MMKLQMMKLQMIVVPLFAAAVLAGGCASTAPGYGGTDEQRSSGHSNENYYAVIVSIESGPAFDGQTAGPEIGKANDPPDVYFIRVRFDDRSYQTVTQASLDGLRVGDSVRIERARVRRY